jgi:6-phosphofructokinase
MPRRTSIFPEEKLSRFHEKDLRIGVLHAGGPAPGGNQVLYAAALRARDHHIPLVAFRQGYQHLISESAEEVFEKWVFKIGRKEVRYLRDQVSLLTGSSRANPGKAIKSPEDLLDPEKNGAFTHIIEVLDKSRIGALISVGGDDTMRTANLLQTHYENMLADGRKIENFRGVVHVPKTIDKDYPGIDFTFGFMSAAQTIGERIDALHKDAKATATHAHFVYHVVEVMGRAAGWLCAASSIYGQSTYSIVPEDYIGNGTVRIEDLANQCVDVILTRKKQGKNYGVITISEGLADLLELEFEAEKDEFGHTRLDTIELSAMLKRAIVRELKKRSNLKTKIHSQTCGYDARQVKPNIFDTLLCQRLGVSAVDAILNEQFGNMISVEGVFNAKLVPFSELVDPKTLTVKTWTMNPREGMYKLLLAMQQPFDVDVDVDLIASERKTEKKVS